MSKSEHDNDAHQMTIISVEPNFKWHLNVILLLNAGHNNVNSE